MFARKADDDLASFARTLDELVTQNASKRACATVVLLAQKADVAARLEAIAKDKQLRKVPLTVAKDGAAGPEEYNFSKDVPVTVVVYDGHMNVTATVELEKLDLKSQEKALAAFAKVLGIEPPRLDARPGDLAKDAPAPAKKSSE